MARLRRAALYALGAGTITVGAACSSGGGTTGPVATPAYGGAPVDATAGPQDATTDSPQDAGEDVPRVTALYGAPAINDP